MDSTWCSKSLANATENQECIAVIHVVLKNVPLKISQKTVDNTTVSDRGFRA